MNKRERILGGAVLLLVVLWGGRAMFMRYRTALASRRTQVEDAKTRLADANLLLAKGRSAMQQMEDLQKRSLPTDREKALSLYKAWLLTKAKASGLSVDHVQGDDVRQFAQFIGIEVGISRHGDGRGAYAAADEVGGQAARLHIEGRVAFGHAPYRLTIQNGGVARCGGGVEGDEDLLFVGDCKA